MRKRAIGIGRWAQRERESREDRVRLQELAKQPIDSLQLPELREVEHHEDPRIAARAADEIQKRVKK